MPLPKPSSYLAWTTATPANRSEPTSGKKDTGWGSSEKPTFQHMNWMFYQTDQWQKYLESITDAHQTSIATLTGMLGMYAAIVGPVGNSIAQFNDLLTALGSSQVVAGSRILVLPGSYTINTTIQCTKNDIEIHNSPGVTYTVGAATTCVQLSGVRNFWRGGRFPTWVKAIQIDGIATYARVYDVNFNSCTTEIDDQNGASFLHGNITE